MEEKIWFSFYKTLNDDTEFQINYKIKKVVSKTGCSKDYIKLITNYLTEMYDVFLLHIHMKIICGESMQREAMVFA